MPEKLGSLLVVDDDANNRDLISRRLQRRGYEVDVEADGRAALARIAQQPYDLVLLDIMMPGVDGMQVLKHLRHLKSRAQLPVIMVTAKDESHDIVEALREGANDYVVKPIDIEVLLARVGTQVVLKRTAESLEESNRRLEQANTRLEEANAQLRLDLEAAAKIQQSHLPQMTPIYENYTFAWRYQPCEQLAGDNLNIMSLSEDHVGFYVLDVSGHGVRAALLSVAINHLLAPSKDDTSVVNRPNRKRESDEDPQFLVAPPRDVAEKLNRHFVFDPSTGQFFTIFYGVLDLRQKTCRYVSTGHPPPLHVTADGNAKLLESSGVPIGLFQQGEVDIEPNEERTVELKKGDRLYVYSDGVIEARHRVKGEFGVDRLADLLRDLRGAPLDQSLDGVFASVKEWGDGAALSDDLSIVGIDVR
jgi:phosphoserine phosphatase RsbU/P